MNALPPALSRYARCTEKNGAWTVFDTFTGHPPEVSSRQTTGMQMHDAEEMVDILNRVHLASDDRTVH